jgi:Raf kinase inhibitor-like YbhB/YbcL family protein
VRWAWLAAALVLLAGCAGDPGAGPDAEDEALRVTSPAFDHEGEVPTRFTCEGEDVSPRLEVAGVPEAAETLAVVVDDPDAPTEDPWVHWLLWDVPADAGAIPEGYPPSGDASAPEQARQGTNDFTEENVRYRGPCPPPDDGAHRYRFTVHAVDATLGLEQGAERDALEAALDGNVLATARLDGFYERG